ncbi:MAG: TRAP transporter large permease [Oscillospiraceae bacterium]|nr:TRAP transporter large permease [Oscillospiraceae bacterium]
MSMSAVAAVGIIVMLALLFLGMNIGMAMLVIGFLGYGYIISFNGAIGILKVVPVEQMSSYALVVAPLFILMGNFSFASGLSRDLYDVGDKWLGRLPGGLACATIAACAGFGAICGSTAATAATMGKIAIPEMRNYGYSDELSTGVVSVGGTLGIIIPPSATFIIYGILTELSIGRLFAAGVVPGVILAFLCICTIITLCKLNPKLATEGQKYSWKERLLSLRNLIAVVVLFIIVLGGMFTGLFTVSEAAAVGALLAFLLMPLRRALSWKSFFTAMQDGVKTTAMSFLIIMGAAVFGKFLAVTQMPQHLADYISTLEVSRYVVFLIIIMIYAFLGCIMEALPMIMLTVPIFLPVVQALGFDGIWFGVIIVLVVEMGLITPPVGMNCYIIFGITREIPLATIFRGSLPFVFPILIMIISCVVWPQLALWLPGVIYG